MAPVITPLERMVGLDTRTGQVNSRTPLIARSEGEVQELVGKSRTLQAILRQIDLVAPTDATVLIFGESGTGKELVAREIHAQSRRRDQPLVRVNCASIPRELYESEFFGHSRGAFTGAMRDRVGRFELADGGTLFLDEVGEIPLELQSKLLRVLQEGEYERVGEDTIRRVDVRIIAATNRDLMKEVEAGRFRRDLYYRLNVYPIEVAPLRRRMEDVPPLATYFIEQASRSLNYPRPILPDDQLTILQQYDWPGNVRELQNVINRAVIVSQGRPLQFDLPQGKSLSLETPRLRQSNRARYHVGIMTDEVMRERERNNLIAALERSHGRIYGPGGAAEQLGVKPTTLVSRIKKLGLTKPK
ncbi:MAG: sigma 54-interacting transcriptional regulator [Nitrospira sp.]|nr:sigma 54-interacting transcriptional regulator [Nitrospira sp.]